MKNRIACFVAAVLLLTLTLCFASCGSTHAKAEKVAQRAYSN